MSVPTVTKFDQKRTIATLNSRVRVSAADKGQQVILQIVGSPTVQTAEQRKAADVAAGKPLAAAYYDQQICNVKANSMEAISRLEVRELFTDAVAAESAGDLDKAHDLFNKFLNAAQMSFSQIINQSSRRFQPGDAVTAFVSSAKTAKGHEALILDNVRYKAPETLAKTSLDIMDLLVDTAAPEVPVTNPLTPEAAKV